MVLYGEGYGGKIQKGSAYRQDKSFILFDILRDGKVWASWDELTAMGPVLGCDTVPYLGRWDLPTIIAACKVGFPSQIGTAQSEGIVARPIDTLFDKYGQRVIIKLKTKDFVPGKR